jgi:hypothetical protein
MSSEANEISEASGPIGEAVREHLRGTLDALSVGRVFGDPYEVDGVTIIPAARVFGGGGGGAGDDGHDADSDGTDEGGFGGGFGLGASALGVYEVRNGTVEWKPAVDVNRLAKGGQVLAGIVAICVTLVLLRRR